MDAELRRGCDRHLTHVRRRDFRMNQKLPRTHATKTPGPGNRSDSGASHGAHPRNGNGDTEVKLHRAQRGDVRPEGRGPAGGRLSADFEALDKRQLLSALTAL